MRALSIMQPWCGLIALGLKPVENRTWRTEHRGPVLLHAGRTLDTEAWSALCMGFHPVSHAQLDRAVMTILREGTRAGAFHQCGVVGEARVVDCVERHDSDWFVGPVGFVLTDARVTEFRPCRGALGFFVPDFASRYAEPRSGQRARS